MAYQTSAEGRAFGKKITQKGKDGALVPPSYEPPLQKPVKYASIGLLLAGLPLLFFYPWAAAACLAVGIGLLFVHDHFVQDDHALVRIYGPVGRGRYLVEDLFRDKVLQYFNETNINGRPIPKIVRDYIYQKAHGVKALSSFGTELDMNSGDNTAQVRVLHRNFPAYQASPASYECVIGQHRPGVQPFVVKNCVNVSAMSYGSLNWKAAECISYGAKGICYVNTGEGGYGPHGAAGNDVVFQIGTGKFGVGDHATLPNGQPTRALNEQLLVDLVRANPHIRMVQLKISQGAKPGIGGHLPAEKVTPEIAAVRKVEPYKSVISPPQHAELLGSSPQDTLAKLMAFIERIRQLTQLPVGIKFAVGQPAEIDLLVAAMQATGHGPDAIQIDGADGGTGAGPNLFVNYVGYGGAVESVAYLDRKLKEAKIRDQVTISASGRLFTPVHAALAFAHGADVVDSARAAMLSLGCIQALKCHTGHCPTGITTNNAWRIHGLVLPEKATRVHKFYKGFHDDMLELTHVMGHADPRDIRPADLRLLHGNYAQHFEENGQAVPMPHPRQLWSE
ncbi:MAG: FMN-binding glutamate synthase family protein [Bernardetiaceae bacterium]|jgi:glutamate synthase domain-containing protein 2|nr:FMN-binding glutamate synthase family protein [Bernardetiaceae bacterium]